MKTFEHQSKLLEMQHKIEFYDWFQNDLQSSLDYLLKVVMEIDWVTGGGIYLWDNKSNDLVLVNHTGLSDRFIKQNSKFAKDTPQAQLILKKEFLFSNYNQLIKTIDRDQNLEKIKAIAILPLFHQGKILGAINIASTIIDRISHDDQLALEIITSKISSIITYHKIFDELKEANIQLDKRVQERTHELEKVNEKLIQEIFTHKKTQYSLSYSENLYHSIFNNANDGIVLLDIKTLRPVDINPAVYEGLGYTRQEFLQLETRDYTIYESEEYRKQVFSQLIQEKSVKYSVKHITKKGKIKHTRIHANIIKINKQEFILGITHDITELIEKENALQKSKIKYRDLQSNIPIGLFMATFEGKILYVNAAIVKMLGYNSEEEVLKIPIAELYQDKNKRKEIISILNKQGFINRMEIQINQKDKSYFWGSLSLTLVTDKENGVVRLDGVIEDITERKLAQHNLEKANKKIQLANQSLNKKIESALKEQQQQQQYIIQKSKLESLGELAAGIAHEINQPLGVMSLIFENLQSKFNSDSITKEYLDQKIASISGNIDRIRDIISHIRIFSREQESIVMQKVNVNEVVLNVHKLIKTQYQNHNITIIHDLQEDLGFTVGSKLKLEQLLLNLHSNAKYALDDNEINQIDEEYQKTIHIKTFIDNNRIHLRIEDNGIGIDSKNINKIFDPFYTTKPEWIGTGLGLSIVYGIIKELHGEIMVESEKDKFTRFDILLPMFPERN